MNYLFKLIFLTLILILALNFSFGQLNHKIAFRLNSAHDLPDPGTMDVYRNDTVFWEIERGEDIEWFQIVGPHHPFISLSSGNNTEMTAIVRKNAPFGKWKYKILYKLTSEHRIRSIDPKIAVKPAGFTNLVLLLGFIITLITSVVFFLKWRIVKTDLKKEISKRVGNSQNK